MNRALSLVLILGAWAASGPLLGVYPPFRSNFQLDAVGGPPATGGAGQPFGLHLPAGASVTVVDGALGLDDQPVLFETADGAATGLVWLLAPAITEGGIEIAFSMSVSDSVFGTVFRVGGSGGGLVEVFTQPDGLLRLFDGCASTTLGAFLPGQPFRVVIRFTPPAAYSAVADGDNDGLSDAPPAEGTACFPGSVTRLDAFARSTLSGPLAVALDDLVVRWLEIFTDGFESGDTAFWSNTVP